MNKLNLELGNFIKDYSIKNYKEDYKVKCDLSYKYVVKNDIVWRKWIGRLKKYLNKNNIFCDGFVISEYDSNYTSLHNHILMYSDKDYYLVEGYIFNFWNKIGSCRIEKYNSDLDYSYYLSKHINKTENNVFDFIENM